MPSKFEIQTNSYLTKKSITGYYNDVYVHHKNTNNHGISHDIVVLKNNWKDDPQPQQNLSKAASNIFNIMVNDIKTIFENEHTFANSNTMLIAVPRSKKLDFY